MGFDHRLYCKVPSEREKVKQELFSRALEKGTAEEMEGSESVSTCSEASSIDDLEEEEGVEVARERVFDMEVEVESIAKVVEIEEKDEDKWEGRWVEGFGWENHDWEWEDLKEKKIIEERREGEKEDKQVHNVLLSGKKTMQEMEEKEEEQENAESKKNKEEEVKKEKSGSGQNSKTIDPFLENFMSVMAVKKTKVEQAVLAQKLNKKYLYPEECSEEVEDKNTEEDKESVISYISDGDMFCDIESENTVFERDNTFTYEYDTEEEVVKNDLGEDILADLTPCDVRVLVHSEDQLSQCRTFERIFPTPKTGRYLKVSAPIAKVELETIPLQKVLIFTLINNNT